MIKRFKILNLRIFQHSSTLILFIILDKAIRYLNFQSSLLKYLIYERFNVHAHRQHDVGKVYFASLYHEKAERLRISEFLGRDNSQNRPVSYLGSAITSSIGHSSLFISLRIKIEQLYRAEYPFDHEMIVGETANSDLIEHFSSYFRIHRVNSQESENLQKQLWPAQESCNALWTPQGVMNYSRANDIFSREYVDSFSDSILILSDESREVGLKFLKKYGFKEGDRFVTIHVRNSLIGPGFRSVESYGRNASIQNYVKAIKYLTSKGIWVIRVGNNQFSQPLNLPLYIDYSQVLKQNSRINTFLLAECLFMIGTNSGPLCVPQTFGRPVIFSNCPSTLRNLFFPDSIFIPKLVVD